MAELNQTEMNLQKIINKNGQPNSLRIHLRQLSYVASTVLNDRIQYETLEITESLDKDTDNSDLCQKFWHTIGSTVTELIIHPRFHVWLPECTPMAVATRVGAIFNEFVCLKKLKISSSYLYVLPYKFFKCNKDVEIVDIYCDNFNTKFCVFDISDRSNDWEVIPEFENFFRHCTLLKNISFPCRLRYNLKTRNEVVAYFTKEFLRVDEVLFESDTLPFDTNCYISKIEIEIIKTRDKLDNVIKKAIVKVVDIEVLWVREIQRDVSSRKVCVFEHNIHMCKSVKSVTTSRFLDHICLTCLEYMIKSFPNARSFITNAECYQPLRSATIIYMSKHLPYLNNLELSYFESLQIWPNFKQLKCLNIKLILNEPTVGIARLCKHCPNLEELRIEFLNPHLYTKINDKIFIEIIAKYLPKIKILEIDSQHNFGGRSLKAISVYLKQLTTLSIGTNEDSRDLLELFKVLPQLEQINYKRDNQWKHLTLQDYQTVPASHKLTRTTDVNARDALEILPEEIWAVVFQSLDVEDQTICRRVCKRWWNIFNSYPKYDRELKLSNCILEHESNPVKTFINTQFDYNRLSLQGPVINCNDKLEEFWCHLGRTIKEICCGSQFTHTIFLRLIDCGMTIENLPNLQSITFDHSDTFCDLFCYTKMTPIFRIIKKIEFINSSFYHNNILCPCPDMPNLECAKIHVTNWYYIVNFSVCLQDHCSNMHTLHISSDVKDEPIPEKISIFRQLKHLKIHGTPNIEALEWSLSNCKNLKTLTIREACYDAENINIREIAIGLFKRLDNLTYFLFLDSRIQIAYKLQCVGSVKNIIEYNYSNNHFLKERVYSQKEVPTRTIKRFKSE